MGLWKQGLAHVAWTGLFISGFPGVGLPAFAQVAATSQATPGNSRTPTITVAKLEEPAPSELPDSPGATASKSEESTQAQSGSQASPPQSTPNQSPSQAPPAGQRPVGTAAAEAPDASGIAASQPAGVAIAPAKQRRTRTIILRMGAIIGAGVAVGSVVALTAATSSKPPGAH
jgi:hypothetical protein